MKKIIFNGEPFFKKEYYGISRHTYEILRELDRIIEPGRMMILSPKGGAAKLQLKNVRIKEIGKIYTKNDFLQKISRMIWKYIIFSFYCRFKRCITINTFTAWGYYFFDVISIYDCTAEKFYMQQLPLDEKKSWHDKLVNNQRKAIQRCKIILTDSISAKNDIVELYNVDHNRIKVIPCGWQHFDRINEDSSILGRLGLKDKGYFFSLGSRMPHKNIKWISYAARNNPQYIFVITGADAGYHNDEFEGAKLDNMIFTGYLSDEEIKGLMHHCKAFIQPSFYEGFGIPPMEAMSVGADCVVSSVASLPEIYKKSVWYINPYDYEHNNMDLIMSEVKENNEMILNEYSWKKSAELLLSVLDELQ